MAKGNKTEKTEDISEAPDTGLSDEVNEEGITLGKTSDRTMAAEDAPTPEDYRETVAPTNVTPRGLRTGGLGGTSTSPGQPGGAPLLGADTGRLDEEIEEEEAENPQLAGKGTPKEHRVGNPETPER